MPLSKKWLKLARSLHQKKYRHAEGLFLVEGAKSVAELLQWQGQDFEIEALFHTSQFVPQPWPARAHVEQVRPEDLEQAGTLQSNDGALAIVSLPQVAPPQAAPLSLALADIRDPGNLGAIIRIADWYGIGQVFCSETTTDWYAPKVIAASMGSFLRVRPHYGPLAPVLANAQWQVYGAVLNGHNLHQVQPAPPALLLIGNESGGIADDLMPYVQHPVTIPRYGHAESLNAAIATAVICDNFCRALAAKF